MASYTDAQGKKITIPDIGQVYRLDDASKGLAVRSGNQLFTGSVQDIGNALAQQRGLNISSGAQAQDLGLQHLLSQGIDYNGLQSLSAAGGADAIPFFERTGGFSRGQLGLNNLDLLKSIAKPGEEISAKISPVNPYGADISSNTQGNIFTSGSVAQNNLMSGQLNPTQAATLQAYAQGSGGQAFPEQLLKDIGITQSAPPPQVQIPSTLGTSSISGSAGLTYQAPTQGTPYNVGGMEVPKTQATLTPTQQGAQDLISRLQGLNTSTQGRSAYQSQQDSAFGVDAAQRALTDLGAQLTGIKNEAAAIPLQLQQGAAERGVTTPLLGAQQNSRLRTNAIAALGVSTLLAAAQGQLANAQSLADKAVAQKFDPIDEQIRATTANLNLILQSPQYDAEVKAQAQAQLEAQQAKAQYVADLKTKTALVDKIAIDAASRLNDFVPNAQFKDATQAAQYIQKLTDPVQAMALAAQMFPPPVTRANPTSSIQEYEYAVSQGYKGSFSAYQNEDANRKAKAAGGGGGTFTPLQALNYSNTVQDNFRQDPSVKIFQESVLPSYQTAQNAYQKNDGAGDIVLMRMIAKMTDPTTGVREEEFRTFEGAQSTLARYGVNLTKRMYAGDRLTQEGRDQLFEVVQDIYTNRESSYNSAYDYYKGQIGQVGGALPPKNVATKPTSPTDFLNGILGGGQSTQSAPINQTRIPTLTTPTPREDANGWFDSLLGVFGI